MIKLGKRVEYGLTALLHLHKNGQAGLVNTHQLSGLYRIPEPHLGKVLQKLAKTGLLEAVHGSHGGYRLGKPFAGVSLGDVVEAVEGPKKLAKHAGAAHRECGGACTCYAHAMVHTAQHRLTRHLYDLKLDTLMPTPRKVTGRNPACHPESERPVASAVS